MYQLFIYTDLADKKKPAGFEFLSETGLGIDTVGLFEKVLNTFWAGGMRQDDVSGW